MKGSTNPLDRTNLHIKNYDVFKVIAEIAIPETQSPGRTDDELAESVLCDLNVLDKVNTNINVNEGGEFTNPEIIKRILKSEFVYFQGADQKMQFKDIVPDLSKYINDQSLRVSGYVMKVAETFCLIDVEGATVYARTNEATQINQIVEVAIQSVNLKNLSYEGRILSKKPDVNGFTNHEYYSVRDNNNTVLIMPVKARDCCAVILKRYDKTTFTYILQESFDRGSYSYKLVNEPDTDSYSSLDEFIDKLKITMRDIEGFKYFKESKEEAFKYMSLQDGRENSNLYAKYCIFFSRKHKECVEILFGNLHLFLKIFPFQLRYKKEQFQSIEDFFRFLKENYPNV